MRLTKLFCKTLCPRPSEVENVGSIDEAEALVIEIYEK